MPRRRLSRPSSKPILPRWIPADQPLYLNPEICHRIEVEFNPRGIFLNIPYSPEYSNYELAIISTATAYQLVPRMARQRMRTESRLLKILEMMLACRYGLADLSYVKRMNMPLELGMLLVLGKETYLTSRSAYGAIKTISDLNFADIHYHRGSLRRLIVDFSRWIEQTGSTSRVSTRALMRRYRRLRQLRQTLGDDFDRLNPTEIARLLPAAEEDLRMQLGEP